jgi:hypothetical protein
VGTAVDIAGDGIALSDDKAGESRVAVAKLETARAGVREVVQAAKKRASGGSGGIQAKPPTVTRQGVTLDASNRPALL